MYVEIPKEAFRQLVPTEALAESIGATELARKTYYIEHGVCLMQIDNFLSGVTQYYIQDVNS